MPLHELQSRFVAGSVYHRLKLPASASSALCPGPDILLRGEGGDAALLLGIGGGAGGLTASGGARAGVKSAAEDGRDTMSVASSIRNSGNVRGSVNEEQQFQKLHPNVLLQQLRVPAVFGDETSAADEFMLADVSGTGIASISSGAEPVASSSAAIISNKVASWLQASEAAFAEERAVFMQDTAAVVAHSAADDNDGLDCMSAEVLVKQPGLHRISGDGKRGNSVSTLSACRIDFERIEMAGGGTLTQPMLLAALRASGTGSMKQVNPSALTQHEHLQRS